MRYYKEFDENGKLHSIGAGDALNGEEITQEEYETLLAEIQAKSEYAYKVYYCEITIDEVPEAYRADVQAEVDEIISIQGAYDPDEISDEEALAIILGGDAE